MEEAARSDQKKRKASWPYLPQSLLELILKRLTLPDYLRFGCVCRLWRTPKQNVFILALPNSLSSSFPQACTKDAWNSSIFQ